MSRPDAVRPDAGARIAIVGAGSVGATIAYACMIRGVGRHLAVYDVDAAKVTAELLDLNHGLEFAPTATVDGGDDPAVCAGADVVVITAGAKQHPGQTRLELAGANVELCRAIVPRMLEVAPDALLLLVTNPVDVLTEVTRQLSGLPAERVVGSGTVLDSARLRWLLAQRCGVAVQNVHAHVVGEHGDSELPLWSTASIGGVPLTDWDVPGHGRLDPADLDGIAEEVRRAAEAIIRGKGATNYAIGLATARILEAILGDERRVLPVSAACRGEHGIDDVCLSLPRIVDRGGAGPAVPLTLDEDELRGLRASADTIRAVVRSLGF